MDDQIQPLLVCLHMPLFSGLVAVHRDQAFIGPVGDLDGASAPHLSDCLDFLLSRGIHHLTMDLERVTFMDLEGLSVITRFVDDNAFVRVSLIDVPAAVRRLVMLSGVRLPLSKVVAAVKALS